VRECGHRLRKTVQGRARNAGADLADTGFPMGNAGINDRLNAGIDDLPDVDAGR
jgi:hypothetical protein